MTSDVVKGYDFKTGFYPSIFIKQNDFSAKQSAVRFIRIKKSTKINVFKSFNSLYIEHSKVNSNH